MQHAMFPVKIPSHWIKFGVELTLNKFSSKFDNYKETSNEFDMKC